MSGDEFLARYGGTADTVTTVEPGGDIACGRRRLTRSTSASGRRRFRQLLRDAAGRGSPRPARRADVRVARQLRGVRPRLAGTDRLVELVRAEGPAAGLYGARITGGGSGGTVAVIGRRDASAAIARVADAYERATGYRPHVFAGSSPGVAAFGARSITL